MSETHPWTGDPPVPLCAYCLWDPPQEGGAQPAPFVINGTSACDYHVELHSSPTSVAALRHKSSWSAAGV
jgi:hypothetical protein